jgi:hypothetical protein
MLRREWDKNCGDEKGKEGHPRQQQLSPFRFIPFFTVFTVFAPTYPTINWYK